MINTELILNMLAEASATAISQATGPETFDENKEVARQGGNVAKGARLELEARTGKKVVTSLSAKKVLKASSPMHDKDTSPRVYGEGLPMKPKPKR